MPNKYVLVLCALSLVARARYSHLILIENCREYFGRSTTVRPNRNRPRKTSKNSTAKIKSRSLSSHRDGFLVHRSEANIR